MDRLQKATIISCGICSGYVTSFVVWNLFKRTKAIRRTEVKIQDECSPVETVSNISLFTDSSSSPSSHSVVSSGSFVSACECLADRIHTLDLSTDYNFRNSVIVNEFLFKKNSEDYGDRFHLSEERDLGDELHSLERYLWDDCRSAERYLADELRYSEEILDYKEILKMFLRKRPNNVCLEFLEDHDLGDITTDEIENQIRFCLQRNLKS